MNNTHEHGHQGPRRTITGDDVHQVFSKAFALLSDAVGFTLGPGGGLALMPGGFTKDGVTVAVGVHDPDPAVQLAIAHLRGTALQANIGTGDGTTTATVMAAAMHKAATSGGHGGSAAVRRQMQSDISTVEAALSAMAVPASGDDLLAVATVSANGDAGIGSVVVDAVGKVGHRGIVEYESSIGGADRVDIAEGMIVQSGLRATGEAFMNMAQLGLLSIDSPLVFVSMAPMADMKSWASAMTSCSYEKKGDRKATEVVLFAPHFTPEFINTMTSNITAGTLLTRCIQAPGMGGWQESILRDIAARTGATPFMGGGIPVNRLSPVHAGMCARLSANMDTTFIVKGAGDITDRLAEISALAEASKGDARRNLEDRAAMIDGKIATIHVSGGTEAECRERRDRFVDAVGATRAALKSGIVPGGGAALMKACAGLNDGSAVKAACMAPFHRIQSNAGWEVTKGDIEAVSAEGWTGKDARDGTVRDMREARVLDPVDVVLSALRSAHSLASLAVGTGSIAGVPA